MATHQQPDPDEARDHTRQDDLSESQACDTEPRDEEKTGEASPGDSQQRALAEMEDRWRRAVADLENLRKRSARDLERVREEERKRVAAAWLPILDNLELALTHAEADPHSVIEGVRAVRDQAVDLLAGMGYPRDEDVGVPFDPDRHEVVSVVDDDPEAPPGTVVRVLRPGYGDNNRQLRPGAVAVARQSE